MPPEVSVVVPVRNAADTVLRTISALDRQSFDGDFELVLVDDASTDATGEYLLRSGHRVVRLDEQAGPAGARNAGIAAATAPLIAFTDADCEPDPGWLQALADALRDHDLVQGPVIPACSPGPFDRTLSLPAPSPRFETANLAVRREFVTAFERLPEVDEGHFGEDVVFGWRAVRAGARRGWAPRAVVRHAVFPRGPRAYIAERTRLRLFPPLVREVPELRDEMPLRVFLTPTSARLDLAVAAVVAAALARRPLLVAGAIPYARARAWMPRRLHRRSVARVNIAFVLGDLIGLAALVYGSVRARRVVL